MARTITRYADFWPYYLREHARPQTRALHYAGTALTFVFLALAIAHGGWWWLLVPIAGYGFAWVAHFRVERNRPATFTIPCGRWSATIACSSCGFPAGSRRISRRPGSSLSIARPTKACCSGRTPRPIYRTCTSPPTRST